MDGSFFNKYTNGSRLHFPMLVHGRAAAASQGNYSLAWFQDLRRFAWFYEDFMWDAFDIDEHPLALYDASASGSPTKDIVANEPGGAFQIKLASTSEAETVALTQNDQLYIRMNKPWYFETRLKKVAAAAANQVYVWGVGSAFNTDTLDSIARNAWFRVDGNNSNLLIEADDATTDDDDVDTTADLTDDTYYIFSIEHTGDGRLIYRKADGDGQNIKSYKLTTETRAFGANNGQIIIAAQKASGTTTPELVIDYVAYACHRV